MAPSPWLQATPQAPTILIEKGASTFSPSSGVQLSGRIFASSVCSNAARVLYRWSSSVPGLDLSASTGPTLFIKRLPMAVPGQAYTFTMEASFSGSASSSSATATLTAVGSPLGAAISGGSGDMPAHTVTFKAAAWDPDDPTGTQPVSASWACVSPDMLPCFDEGDYLGMQEGATWTIDLAKVI